MENSLKISSKIHQKFYQKFTKNFIKNLPKMSSVISYCSISITPKNIHFKKIMDDTCCLLEKQI